MKTIFRKTFSHSGTNIKNYTKLEDEKYAKVQEIFRKTIGIAMIANASLAAVLPIRKISHKRMQFFMRCAAPQFAITTQPAVY